MVLHKTGEWKGVDLARLFGCSPGRVSQIVSDYYHEHRRLGFDVEPATE